MPATGSAPEESTGGRSGEGSFDGLDISRMLLVRQIQQAGSRRHDTPLNLTPTTLRLFAVTSGPVTGVGGRALQTSKLSDTRHRVPNNARRKRVSVRNRTSISRKLWSASGICDDS